MFYLADHVWTPAQLREIARVQAELEAEQPVDLEPIEERLTALEEAEPPVEVKGIAFYIDGDVAVETSAMSFIAPCDMTITNVKAAVDTAPTGADLIIDIHKNGTTIFTTQSNRPTIAATETSEDSPAPDVTSISAGDKITLEIDQIGSTVAGENLSVVVVAEVS